MSGKILVSMEVDESKIRWQSLANNVSYPSIRTSRSVIYEAYTLPELTQTDRFSALLNCKKLENIGK